jgi:hypothetical protein
MDIVERLWEFEFVKDYWGDWEIAKEAANEIERLREALREITKRNPFHNVSPPINKQYYAQIIVEMVDVANAALKEGE